MDAKRYGKNISADIDAKINMIETREPQPIAWRLIFQ